MAAAAAVLEIPEDLWFEVLLKVPTEDVVKYRRLSKFHRKLIDSPDFRRKHNELQIKTASRRHHVIISDYKSDDRGYLGSFDHRVDFRSINTVHRFIPPIKKERDRYKNSKLVGCCMGILCYEVRYLDCLILWNPLTNCSRKVSVKPTELRYNYVLGHDSVANDLKILRTMEKSTTFDIYSSRMNSWTKQSAKGYVHRLWFYYKFYQHPIFLESTNSIHWFYVEYGQGYNEVYYFVVAYNLSTQEFNKFSLPKTTEPDGGVRPGGISSLGGCLCMTMYPNARYLVRNCLEVWTMKEYGAQDSWTRLFSIRHYVDDTWDKLTPLVLLNNGNQLALLHHKHALYICDMETLDIHTTDLKKQLDFRFLKLEILWPFIYTPTLREP